MLPCVARADAPTQMVGLFIQGCMPFVGDAKLLRTWAQGIGLPEVPDPARAAFLHNAPGKAFDGSNGDGRFVLISSDDGLCSVATDKASEADVTKALQAGFAQAGLRFRMVIERDDKVIPAIHDREYLATRNGRGWRVLSATVKDNKAGEAMLTAAPE